MDKIKKMWCNLSLRKSIILYISAFVILAILLSAGTATLCNNATKTIESKYPPTGEKYYLTNENGERLGDGNYIGVAPVAMSEKDQRLLSICEVAPIIATPIYSALCIITATLLFYRNKLKKPLTELKAASEMISNNNLNFSIKYDSKDELGELCSSFETMRFTLANNFSEMWRQMEERKQLNAAFAHDLRTPLTVLKGYNEILQSNHDPITKSTAVTMGKHIFRLERYVDSMSHLRRLEDAQPISDNIWWERYADDGVLHCQSYKQAVFIKQKLEERFQQFGLELNKEKTRIVYCKDDRRSRNYSCTQFTFLGYTFRPRLNKNKEGKFFVGFTPAVSEKAKTAMKQKIRGWKIQLKADLSLKDIGNMINKVVQGWINYYTHYYKSEFYEVLRYINQCLIKWVRRSYKKKNTRSRAEHWLGAVARRDRNLFAHWKFGILPSVGEGAV